MEPLESQVVYELSLVLHPELAQADNAFQSSVSRQLSAKSPEVLDKELRAVMLRLMTQLLQGYRSCLTLVRIHPEPFISFHKAAFLGLRSSNVSIQDSGNFLPRLLDCMFFNEFVHTRGPPWRKCDIFDELYSNLGEMLGAEAAEIGRSLANIQALARQLLDNESQSSGTA